MSENTLVANGDITSIDTSGYQILQTTNVTLTASQFAGFTSIISGTGTGGIIYCATGGTYDLEGKSTEAYTLFADSNAGTTLIGNDANGAKLTASTSGADTLEGGNGNGDDLFAGGGTDTLIAGSGTGDYLYIGTGVDTVTGGNGGDIFVLGEDDGTSVAAGTTLNGGTGQDTLIAGMSGAVLNISGLNISGIETLETTAIGLTASQFAGFSAITSGGSILPLSLYAESGGTFDLEGKSTGDYALIANSNAGTTLIGDDAGGEILRASASGTDTLQAGNGSGDRLYAGGGTDTLIAGNGTGDQLYGGAGSDTYVLSNTASATITGGTGAGTAVFAGDEANYTISVSLGSGVPTTVTNMTTGAVDTLTNVQILQFADVTVEDTLALAGGPLSFLTDPVVNPAVASELANGSLSYSGMLTVLQDVANQGTVTASEFSSLQTLVSLFNLPGGISVSPYVEDITTRLIDGDAANEFWTGGGTAVALGNLAAGTTATELNELIGKWFLGTDLPNAQGTGIDPSKYKIDSDPLFGSKGVPLYTDANQGELGDCYLIASLGEIALQDPASIELMITSEGNGVYSVRFDVDGQADYVTVNTELAYFTGSQEWSNKSALVFANGSPIWAALIEKAYVELNAEPGVTGETTGNVYYDIASGDAEPITLITGKPTAFYSYNEYGSEASWASGVQSIASSAFKAGEEVLVGTGDQISNTSEFVSDHMFEVIGYNASTGLFTLYNPWGTDYAGTDPAVTFTASMADIYNNEGTFYVASGEAISPATIAIASAVLESNQATITLSGTIDTADAGQTILIYDGTALLETATANSSGAWTANVIVSTQGLNTLTAQAANAGGTGTSNSIIDLDNASTSLSGGGQLVVFSGSEDSVSLSNTAGTADSVTGSGGTVTLDNAQASITGSDTILGGGGSDTVIFSGDRANYIVSDNATSATVTNISTGAVDTLTGIQTLQFADVSLSSNYEPSSDFYGTGTSDILLLNSATGSIVDWQMNGAQVASVTGLGGNPAWTVVGTGDFYGTGTSDILLFNATTGSIVDWQMNAGQVASAAALGGDPAWAVVGTGDFSGNGTSDILLENATTGSIVEWQMNGGQVASAAALGGSPAWSVVGTGDFTGNGQDDILLENASTGSIVEWQMNGSQIASVTALGGGAGWSVVGTGDFSGNGTSDILLQNATTGAIAEWQMNGGQVASTAFLGGSPGWNVAGTGDYFGNGHADILLQNASTGSIVQWEMNGSQIVSNAALGGNASWKVAV